MIRKIVITIGLVVLFNPTLSAKYSVRFGEEISNFEQLTTGQRLLLAQERIKQLLPGNDELDESLFPHIGLVHSGGGCRAAIATLALWQGLGDLLDACLYISALSGSTWMLAAWLEHGYSLLELKNYMQQKLSEQHTFDKHQILEYLLHKISEKKTITITDMYGCFVADRFLKNGTNNPYKICFSSVCPKIENGKYPFPLCSAMIDNLDQRENMEFSPNEVGSMQFLKTWAPTESLGKKFENGVSFGSNNEESLSYLLGIFGSAYAFDCKDVIKFLLTELKNLLTKRKSLKNENKLSENVTDILNCLDNVQDNERESLLQSLFKIAGRVPNFTKGVNNCPLNEDEELVLIDAGIECNLPFAPLLDRGLNMYIVCDASGGRKSDVIKDLEKYAQRKGYLLPPFDYQKIDANEVCLFYDPNNPHVPVVVYFPLTVSEQTTKFFYTNEEFNHVYDAMHNLVAESHNIILEGIKIAIENQKRCMENNNDTQEHNNAPAPVVPSSWWNCNIL